MGEVEWRKNQSSDHNRLVSEVEETENLRLEKKGEKKDGGWKRI